MSNKEGLLSRSKEIDMTPKKIINKLKKHSFYRTHLNLSRFRKISHVVSYPKCGRTWVATVMAHYVGRANGTINEPLPFSSNPNREYKHLFKLNRKAIFTHGDLNKKFEPSALRKFVNFKPYENKPLIFLIRNPRDVVVSHYHHMIKKENLVPSITLEKFVSAPHLGLPKIIAAYNIMANYAQNHKETEFIQYEDLRNYDHSLDLWGKLLSTVFESDIDESALKWALEVNDFENMKKREKEKNAKGGRVRSGKIGGYQEEMEPETIQFCENYINENLDDFFSFYKRDN